VIAIAVGLLIALATFTLLEAIVANLIAPLIAAFVGEAPFLANSFSINSSEFGYGYVIQSTILFVFVAAVAYLLLALSRRRGP
jgi:large-conductance mechanosensitive channel